jgi:hypothetical protein
VWPGEAAVELTVIHARHGLGERRSNRNAVEPGNARKFRAHLAALLDSEADYNLTDNKESARKTNKTKRIGNRVNA